MQPKKSGYWWIFFIRGCLAILFGFTALFLWPILELGLMGSFFGVYIFIQGALTLVVYLKIIKATVACRSCWRVFWG